MPDLAVEAVDVSALDRELETAQVSGTVTVTIRNDGEVAVEVATQILLFEDRDLSGDYDPVEDTWLGEAVVPPLGAVSRSDLYVPVGGVLTFSGAPIHALIDGSNLVREIDETNNVRSSGDPSSAPPCTEGVADFAVTRVANLYDHGDPNFLIRSPAKTPIVAHLTDDNQDGLYDDRDDPTILVQALPPSLVHAGELAAIRGTTGELLASIGDPEFFTAPVRVASSQGFAVGNVDDDPEPEVVVTGFTVGGGSGTRIAIFDNHLQFQSMGGVLPRSETFGSWYNGQPSIAIANLDGRGAPEIVVGAYVCNNRGMLLDVADIGDGMAEHGGRVEEDGSFQSAVADIDGDGDLELIAGATVYSFDGRALHVERRVAGVDGWVAVANFDEDPDDAEIVVASRDGLRLYDAPPLPPAGAGGLVALWSSPWHPPGGGGADDWAWTTGTGFSAPAAKDFDGDGVAEILIGAGQAIGAVQALGSSLTDAQRVEWMFFTGGSSPPTPTAFDLDGDGIAEILHVDGTEFRIVKLETGTPTEVFTHPRTRFFSDRLEMPVVADVDHDGHAEVLMTSGQAGSTIEPGLYVFGDEHWMPARSTWNQAPYGVMNVLDDGTIPRHPTSNWRVPAGAPANDYKCQHAPDAAASCLAMPNLTVSRITADDDACGTPTDLHAVVGNGGGAPSPAGVDVTFYAGDPSWGNVLGGTTLAALAPGESVTVEASSGSVLVGEAHVVVDEDEVDVDVEESNEADNVAHARVSAGCDPAPTSRAVVLTLDEPTSSVHGQPVELSATLEDEAADPDAPVEGVFVTFELGSATCRALTDESGVASCWVTPHDDAGSIALSATSDATSRWASDEASLTGVTLALAPRSLALETPTIQVDTLTVAARLLENGSRAIPERTVVFSSSSAADDDDTTDMTGRAGLSFDVHAPGTHTVSATVAATATHDTVSVGPLSVTLLAPQIAMAEAVSHVDEGSEVEITAVVLDDGRELENLPIAFARQSGSHSTDAGTGNPGTTDATGRATWTYTAADTPGTDVVHAWIDLDEDETEDAGEPVAEATVIIGRKATSLAFIIWPLEGTYHEAIPITAKLTRGTEYFEGETVTITLGDESCRAITDEIGHATCWLTPQDADAEVTATFTGSPELAPSEVTDDFQVLPQETRLVGSIVGGTLEAWLMEESARPIGDAWICIDTVPPTCLETDPDTGYVTAPSVSPTAIVTYAGADEYDAAMLTMPRWFDRFAPNYTTAMPADPEDVTATALGAGAIEVTFTAGVDSAAPPAEGFQVLVDDVIMATLNGNELVSGEGTVQVSGIACQATAHEISVVAVGFLKDATASTDPESAETTSVVLSVPSEPEDVDLEPGTTPTLEWADPADDGGDDDFTHEVACTQSVDPFEDATSPLEVDELDAGPNTCWVRTANGEGNGPWAISDAEAGGAAPSAPVLQADAGSGQVKLFWTQPEDLNGSAVDHYVVSMDGTPLVPDVEGHTVTLTVTGLTNGTAHDFEVKACNGVGCGSDSTEVTATPLGAPGAPTAVSATNDRGTIVVSWTNPASNGGSALTGHALDGGTAATTAAGTATSSRLTELPLGTPVTPEVDAVNAHGSSSAASATASATPARQPEKPTDVEATSGTDGSVTITWDAPSEEGGATISGYVITTIPDSGPHEDTGTALTETLTGLPLGIPHVAFVQAINAVGTGAESDASDAFTPHSAPCEPRGLTLSIAGDTSLLATWIAPECDGGEPITEYTLAGDGGSCMAVSVPVTGGARRRVLTSADGLVAGCTYAFSITATNTVGTSTADEADPITVARLPQAPTLSGDPTAGDGELTVAWSLLGSGEPEGWADILSYRACPLPANAPCVDVPGDATSATIGDLTNGTSYRVELRARNVVGLGAPATSGETDLLCGPPASPSWVVARQVGEESIEVSWAETYDGGCAPVTYSVHVDDGGTGWDVSAGQDTTIVIDSGLTACDEYAFTVTATNDRALEGESSQPSDPIAAALVPEPPADVEILAGDGCAVIRWSPPSDLHCANLIGYRITVEGQDPVEVGVGSRCVLVPGLTNLTTYDVDVVALSDVGESDDATPTDEVTPDVPTLESVEFLGEPDPPDTGDDTVQAGATAILVIQLSGVASPEGTTLTVSSTDGDIAEPILSDHVADCGEARIEVPVPTFLLGGTVDIEVTLGSTMLADTLVVGGASGTADCLGQLESPSDGGEVTDYGTEVWGSAEWDGTGGSWELEICPATREFDETVPCTTLDPLEDDTAPARHALLAKIDPTLLMNGEYVLNLVTNPPVGDPCVVSRSITIAGQQKVGAFRLSFVDMTIPVAGMPIQVIRSYDSLDKRVGDFGVGWRLSFQDVRLETARPTSTDWRQPTQGFAPFYQQCLGESRAHVVTVTFPDGTTHRFQPMLSRHPTHVVPCGVDTVAHAWIHYVPLGTRATLRPTTENLPYDPREVGYLAGEGQIFWEDGDEDFSEDEPYEPTDFELTTEDGTVWNIRRGVGLTSVVDPNGNTLTFSSSGISSSNAADGSTGPAVAIARDGNGQVTAITDPRQHATRYCYATSSGLPKLTRFFDRAAASYFNCSASHWTQFDYEMSGQPFLVTDVSQQTPSAPATTSPPYLRTEYDEDGRVERTCQVIGTTVQGCVEMAVDAMDLENHEQVVTDLRGNSVTFTYDERGRVTLKVDADGDWVTEGYTEDDQPITERTPRTDGTEHAFTHHGYDAQGNVTSVENSEGDVATYAWGPQHRLASMSLPGQPATTYSYDSRGNLATVVDPLGHETYTHANAHGNVELTRDALQQESTTFYWFDHPWIVTDAAGGVTTTEHDENGNAVAVSRSNGDEQVTTVTEYDAEDRVIRTTGPEGSVRETAYDDFGRVHVERELASRGANASSADDDTWRETTTIHDDYGNVKYVLHDVVTGATRTPLTYEEYDHDLNHNRIFERSTTKYSGWNALSEEPDPADPPDVSVVMLHGYDEKNRLVKSCRQDVDDVDMEDPAWQLGCTTTKRFPETGITWHRDERGAFTVTEEDMAGRAVVRCGPFFLDPPDDDDPTSLDCTGRPFRTQTGYDAAGRVATTTDPLGFVTLRLYDDAGRRYAECRYDGADPPSSIPDTKAEALATQSESITDPEIVCTVWDHDALGRVVGEHDRNGRLTQYGHDEVGRLTSVTDARDKITSYGFDDLGNMTTQVDAKERVTSYEFDGEGRRTARELPLHQRETFTYGIAGTLQAQIDFAGKTIAHEDADFDGAEDERGFETDPPVAFTYWGDGQRKTVTDALGETTYGRDLESGRLTSIEKPLGTHEATLSYTWDEAGNRTSITTTVGLDSHATTYAYNASGQVIEVSDAGGTIEYEYDAAGRLWKEKLQGDAVVGTWAYDDLTGGVTSLTWRVGPAPTDDLLWGIEYTLDKMGRRTAALETRHDSSTREVTWTFDELYRLTDEVVTGGQELHWEYDDVGNRLLETRTEPSSSSTSYGYDANDRMQFAGAEDCGWDPNGNMTAKGATEYGWDDQDRMTSADGWEFTYDADGLKQSMTSATESIDQLVDGTFAYAQVLEDRAPLDAALVARYMRGAFPVRIDVAGTGGGSWWYLHDALGSTRVLLTIDGSGSADVTDRWDYEAFGSQAHDWHATTGECGNQSRWLFAGEERHRDTGLDYLRARWSSDADGRFNSVDPQEAVPASTKTLGRYLLNLGDPINLQDPSGLFAEASIASAASSYQGSALNFAGCLGVIAVSAPRGSEERARVEATQLMSNAISELDAKRRCHPSTADEHFEKWLGVGGKVFGIAWRMDKAIETMTSALNSLQSVKFQRVSLLGFNWGRGGKPVRCETVRPSGPIKCSMFFFSLPRHSDYEAQEFTVAHESFHLVPPGLSDGQWYSLKECRAAAAEDTDVALRNPENYTIFIAAVNGRLK